MYKTFVGVKTLKLLWVTFQATYRGLTASTQAKYVDCDILISCPVNKFHWKVHQIPLR